ncbi:MAG: PilZ domain-containing protein [Candidatus Omnitrophota bacterium]
MIWDGIDQRRFPRVNYKCLIRISEGGREEVIDTFTENIGAGGICVVLEKGFDLFEKVGLEVSLGGSDEPIHCDGSIVWVVKRHPAKKTEKLKFDTGIEFINIQENDRERVSRLVDDIIRSQA